ncbi:MAG: HAMP domain-containing sensor histidine kinase [Myxococcales bacterium]
MRQRRRGPRHAYEHALRRYHQHRLEHHRHFFHDHHEFHRVPRPLHKLMFWSFGAAILATMLIGGAAFGYVRKVYGFSPWMPFAAMFLAANFVWGLSGIVARRIAMPLRELERVARELGAGRLDQRVTLVRGAYEVRELAVTFNEMADRIEAQVKSQKELLGAVSHELRTPLARLRILVGSLAEMDVDPKLACHMEREILELDALVGELLAGARVDAGALQKRDLDVADMLKVCLERADFPQASVQISPGSERVQADATLLSRALMVLLTNVRKHAGATRVWLKVESDEQGTQFRVEDDGAGFDPEDLPRVFAPFVRGRGETPDEHKGLGLGLYLVKRIAEAHGGEAFAENRADGGACVGFTLAA